MGWFFMGGVNMLYVGVVVSYLWGWKLDFLFYVVLFEKMGRGGGNFFNG